MAGISVSTRWTSARRRKPISTSGHLRLKEFGTLPQQRQKSPHFSLSRHGSSCTRCRMSATGASNSSLQPAQESLMSGELINGASWNKSGEEGFSSSESKLPNMDTIPVQNADSSQVKWENVLLPRPSQEQHADHSVVSWEEVLMPCPARRSMFTTNRNDGTTVFASRDAAALLLLTVLVMVASLGALLTVAGPNAGRYFLAGGICAATSHSIPVPIDVIKTRKQVDISMSNQSFITAGRLIVQQDGIQALFGGLGPTTVGYLIEGAIKFGTYEVLKPFIRNMLTSLASVSVWLHWVQSQFLAFVLCGAVSGLAASIALCPMEAVRIRMVAQPEHFTKGWIRGGFKMLQQEGIESMAKGVVPMIYKQVPYTVTKNVAFDTITRSVYSTLRNHGYAVTSTTKFTVPFVSALLSSLLSCVSSQPGDMLLSLVNAREGDRRTTNDIIQDILRSERGVRGFFVGIKTRLLHVGIIVTLQLFIYDLVKRLCGIEATGSV